MLVFGGMKEFLEMKKVISEREINEKDMELIMVLLLDYYVF